MELILGPSKKTVERVREDRNFSQHLESERRQQEMLKARIRAIEVSMPYITEQRGKEIT